MPKIIIEFLWKKVALVKVDNAIIMAAGTSSRFAPLSYEMPKALIEVRKEILIERQIKQLKEVGIDDIIIVTGYKADQFEYLKDKYSVILVHNPYYLTRNNNSSIYVVKEYLRNSYICSSDNYFLENPFDKEVENSFYASVYVDGKTDEWCIEENNGFISNVVVGGANSWIMLGHVFWSSEFSNKFRTILEKEYNQSKTADKLWETIYIEHIQEFDMKVKKYPSNSIFEFDTLDELREFDSSYKDNTRSAILKNIAKRLHLSESEIVNVKAFRDKNNAAAGFTFNAGRKYRYFYNTKGLEEINP